ncbi:sugar ABC transporter ATP-binding protein [Ohessyouella blattaphilus]|uniref:Sugar ABC transporter ATP-binding protein n=1 Tax=Ohessyouella blattaphilus TaxID=2949333 RepID=A0ABT1EI24_9FIRM|nr:sugar ABC transporter ATP-binding protein [Ohessyouella blattaphilus]MCP1110355.1 sugar ABC transporter ATP-binding protein [Ohessyouella blattaphilus]MCR8563749.1 sugar ABC transporter ATP-binding protein [Ohessyouella blattaphilus]
MNAVLRLVNVSKTYPGVKALADVSLKIYPGEVHALMGENGAGKSTLIKIISGAIEPDCGEIFFEEVVYSKMNPILSQKLGIGVIYQEFNLVPELSVAENIYLGKKVNKGALLNRNEMVSKAQKIIDEFGIDIDVRRPVKELTIAYQQLVEIAKTLTNDVKVLIMDEPTAPLTNRETEALFRIVARLKEQGIAIIYISHRMEEIFEISQKVSVLRDGKYVDTKKIEQTSREDLISLMVGRTLNEQFPTVEKTVGSEALRVEGLCTKELLRNISFTLHEGEILGFAGLVGAGRTETVRAIFGADPISAGRIFVDNREVKIDKPKTGIRNGIALIPEDRKHQGALLEMSIKDNISFISVADISRGTIIDRKKDRNLAVKYIDTLKIKTPDINQKVKNLSGGNQQKVVLAKSLASKSNIIIFDEPTRGIDVGAKQEIYALMNELVSQGMAIIMISSEMPELMGMSDRIVVMHEGKITGEVSKEEMSQEYILKLASGYKEEIK